MTIAEDRAAAAEAPAAPEAALRNRPIEPSDLPQLAALLAEGFPARGEQGWRVALERLHALSQRAGRGMGYVLAAGQVLVGVLLVIPSPDGRRANMSSWYVRPAFRRYAGLPVSAAVRDRSVTYLNISSEKHTRPVIEAQGFRRYADGVFVGLPLLGRGAPRGLEILADAPPAGAALDAAERALADAHREFGCTVVWRCEGGRAAPFVFARRRIANRIPAAQVVYCPADADWSRLARPIGRALLRKGLLCLLVDAAGPLPGMPGRFLPGRMPKYARGPEIPRLGDLAWTEAAIFGT